jgi:hypothetical protein
MDRGLDVASRIVGKLGARRVATIRPPNRRKAGVAADGGNLYLQITTGNHGNISRSWVFRYELLGQRREMGLGPLHTLNLRKARLKARELREQLLNNIDPLVERQKARQALIAERAKTVTFEKVATMYFDLHADSWGAMHRADQQPSPARVSSPWQACTCSHRFGDGSEIHPALVADKNTDSGARSQPR